MKGIEDIMEYLSIQLDVYRDKSSKPQILTFRPNEYFDLDEGECVDVDSAPKYSHLCDYVSNAQNVVRLVLNIRNLTNGKSLRIDMVYQNNQSTSVATRSEYEAEALTYKEIIYESKLPQGLVSDGCAYDLCRFVVHGSETKCIYHAIFHYTNGGEEIEHRII